MISTGHSHVLVNPITTKTQLIDLEGKSTVYTEKKDIYFSKKSLDSLTILTLEFLLQIDYENYKEYPEEMEYELKGKKIPLFFREKLMTQEMTEIEDFYELSRILKK